MPNDLSLFTVVGENDVESFRQILNANPKLIHEVNSLVLKQTVLHVATACCHVEMIKEIIKVEPQLVNTGDADARYPLHMAALQSRPDIIKILIDANANVNITDKFNLTPLHLVPTSQCAVFCSEADRAKSCGRPFDNHYKSVKLLVDAGADTSVKESGVGRTPLHCAILQDNLDIINELIRCSDVNARDNRNNTPLHYAAMELKGFDETLSVLAKERGSALVRRQMAQMFACGRFSRSKNPNHYQLLVQALLDHGADMNARDLNERIPLHMAAVRGNIAVVQQLLNVNDLNACDKYQNTALHFAATEGNIDALLFLVKSGVDLERRNCEGMTALHAAAWSHCNTVRTQVKNGHTINAVIHGAIFARHNECVKILLNFGANRDVRDSNNKTPLDLALEIGNEKVAQTLRDI